MHRKELHHHDFDRPTPNALLNRAVRILESPAKLAHAKVREQKALLAEQSAQAGFIIKQNAPDRPGSAAKSHYKKIPAARRKNDRPKYEGKIVTQNGVYFAAAKTRNSNLHDPTSAPLYRTEPTQNVSYHQRILEPSSDLARELHRAFQQQASRLEMSMYEPESSAQILESPRFQEPQFDSDSIYSDTQSFNRHEGGEHNAFLISLKRDGPEEPVAGSQRSQKMRKQRRMSEQDETRIESRMDSGNRSMEEEKMVRMLDNIVDELKPYYFFNQKRGNARGSEPDLTSLSESVAMTPGFMGSPREARKYNHERTGSIGSQVSLGTFGRDTMRKFKLNIKQEVRAEERKLEEKRAFKRDKGTSELIMDKYMKPQPESYFMSSDEDEKPPPRTKKSLGNSGLKQTTSSPGMHKVSSAKRGGGGVGVNKFDSLEPQEVSRYMPSSTKLKKHFPWEAEQEPRQTQLQNYMSTGQLESELQSTAHRINKKPQPSQQKMQQKLQIHAHEYHSEQRQESKSNIPPLPETVLQRVGSERKSTATSQQKNATTVNKLLTSGGRKALAAQSEKQKEKLALALMQQERVNFNQKGRSILASKVSAGVAMPKRGGTAQGGARTPTYLGTKGNNGNLVQDWAYYSGQIRTFPRRMDGANTTFTYGSSGNYKSSAAALQKQLGQSRSKAQMHSSGGYRGSKSKMRTTGASHQQSRDDIKQQQQQPGGFTSYLDSSISNYDLRPRRIHTGKIEMGPRSHSSVGKPGRSFSPVYL